VFGRVGGGISVSASEVAMCTHGGMEPGMCGSLSSFAVGEAESWTVDESDARCAISGIVALA
jgi:hypothetical protein